MEVCVVAVIEKFSRPKVNQSESTRVDFDQHVLIFDVEVNDASFMNPFYHLQYLIHEVSCQVLVQRLFLGYEVEEVLTWTRSFQNQEEMCGILIKLK